MAEPSLTPFLSYISLTFYLPWYSEVAHILKLECNVLGSGFSRRPWVGLALLPALFVQDLACVFLAFRALPPALPSLFPVGLDLGVFHIYPHKSM